MKAEQKAKLDNIIQNVLGVKASEDLTMDSVANWDSLRHIQLLAKIEQAFGLSLDFQDTLSMTSLKAIRQVIEKYLDGK